MSAQELQSEPFVRRFRIVVVSEHALARAGICAAVRAQPDFELAGEYEGCRAALPAVMNTPPDAVVVELAPGGEDVLDAISRCHNAFPHVAHVVISQTRDHELAERAVKAGALAFVYKGVGPASLAAAIRDALAGQLLLCRCIASPLLHKAIYGVDKHKTKHPDLAKLSPREFQIFQLLGSGWDNPKIAQTLGISIKTLNAHKENMKDKLKTASCRALNDIAASWTGR